MIKTKPIKPSESHLVECFKYTRAVNGDSVFCSPFYDLYVTYKGQVLTGPVTGKGSYNVQTGVSRFFPKLRTITTDGELPVQLTVIYIAKYQFDFTYGVGEIDYTETLFSTDRFLVHAMAGGNVKARISNGRRFITEISGMSTLDKEDIEGAAAGYIVPVAMNIVSNELAEDSHSTNNQDAVQRMMSKLNQARNNSGNLSSVMLPDLVEPVISRVQRKNGVLCDRLQDGFNRKLSEIGLEVCAVTLTIRAREEDEKKLQEIENTWQKNVSDIYTKAVEINVIYGGNAADKFLVDAVNKALSNPGIATNPFVMMGIGGPFGGAAQNAAGTVTGMAGNYIKNSSFLNPNGNGGMITCPKCGKPNPPGSVYCNSCGKKLT